MVEYEARTLTAKQRATILKVFEGTRLKAIADRLRTTRTDLRHNEPATVYTELAAMLRGAKPLRQEYHDALLQASHNDVRIKNLYGPPAPAPPTGASQPDARHLGRRYELLYHAYIQRLSAIVRQGDPEIRERVICGLEHILDEFEE